MNEDAYTLQNNKLKIQSLSISTDNENGKVQAYEYCIVTPKKFANAFRRVASIKRAKGINAGVVYLEEILSDERFKNGTLKPANGSSEAILREFLYWSYINGCRYALLGGKPPLVPTAFATSSGYNGLSYNGFDDFTKKHAEWQEYYIPTDLYFSNFDNDWDCDGDGLYGEFNDKLSYNSQIAIGRLPCTTEEEIINYVHKLEFYEFGLGMNPAHYGKCHSILADLKNDYSDPLAKDFYKDIISSCTNVFQNAAFYELVVISSTGNNYSKSILTDYGIEDKSIDPNDMVYVCQGDAIPYVSDLKFAGDDLKSGYIYCNNASIGCRESNRKQTVTKVYGKTTIDAMGDVKLGATLDIAGDLVIYAKGSCTLDSVTILSNGNLEIHCDDIRFAEEYEQSVYNNGKLQFFNYDKYDSDPKPYMSYKPKALRAKSEHEYIPLLEGGKAWWYNYKVVTNLIHADVHDRNLTLKLEGKKEIDGKEYSVLNLYIDGVFDDIAAYLYEDTDSKRVYIKTEDYRPSILNEWYAVYDGLLYDFNDPEMPVLHPDYNYNKVPVEIEVNGNTYFGWRIDDISPMAAVEGLGLIPYLDDYDNGKFPYSSTATLLGERLRISGGELNIYPYLYKITDKNGNVLYEIKGNELSSLPSSSTDNRIYARVEGKTILIDNPLATHVTVTNAAGMQIHQSSDTNIRLEVFPGLYMVIGGNNATKLIVN